MYLPPPPITVGAVVSSTISGQLSRWRSLLRVIIKLTLEEAPI